MSELKKLLEGLPIRILDKNCAEIGGGRYLRSQIQRWADDEANGTSHRLGARLILALMDEFEEPKPEVGSSAPPYCVEHNCQMILSVYNRPGSPPGNGWSCPECANERESKAAEKPTWEPGDWFRCKFNFCNGGQFARIDDDYIVDKQGGFHLATDAYHVPAPRKEDPFTGPEWDENKMANEQYTHPASIQRDIILRDELRRMREGK